MPNSHRPRLCTHMTPGPSPLESLLVLDDHLGPAEWLVRCRSCPACYLLEMLDVEQALRLYRIRSVDPEAARALVRDLNRGSCDINRAGEQARHLSLSSERLRSLLLIDVHANTLVKVIETEKDIPGAGWRELACDGSWISRLG